MAGDLVQLSAGLRRFDPSAKPTSMLTMLAAAGFDRFLLDPLCLDDEALLRCEVGRVREALDRLALLAP